ncbi:Tim44 domain-containing protein [Neptuniibacter halophilus]|uniref:Tim44 domain-containing protein n=1 Tax=Neptuniibacter halophilus TaxID=651666 RepID=UPI0025745C55|nr:TIM44-like domain-containing protein [Neptuniibacter halophilus]
MAVFLISLPIAEQADAKRLGGGSSFGKSFSSPKKSQSTPTQQQAQQGSTVNKTATTPTRRSGFGGMMAGLLAGGIFGALLFGGAFEGLQFMDLLLIAGLIFVVYKIFAMRKPAQAQNAYASNGPQQYEIKPHDQNQQREQAEPQAESFKPMPSFSSGWGETSALQLPQWFNREAFLEGAREHFITLQKAWDENNWDEISSYTSPELFNALREERKRHPQDQVTEVVSVMTELTNFIEQPGEVIVSINFYGWLKENSDETTEFNETWHLSRSMNQPNADWFIVGIEQN